MNAATLPPLARDYLKRLGKAARRLPRARRNELIEEIEAHLGEALPPGASETEVREVLERLGEPEQIVAAAAPEAEVGFVRAGVREWLAIPLLLLGGLLVPTLPVGWFVGVLLLWSSRIWTVREKTVGTLMVPGGLVPALLLFGGAAQVCQGAPEPATHLHPAQTVTRCTPNITSLERAGLIAAFVVLLVLPLVSAVYLARRSSRAPLAVA